MIEYVLVLLVIILLYILFSDKKPDNKSLFSPLSLKSAGLKLYQAPVAYAEADYRGLFSILPPGDFTGDDLANIIQTAQIKSIFMPPGFIIIIRFRDNSYININTSTRNIINSDVPIVSFSVYKV